MMDSDGDGPDRSDRYGKDEPDGWPSEWPLSIFLITVVLCVTAVIIVFHVS